MNFLKLLSKYHGVLKSFDFFDHQFWYFEPTNLLWKTMIPELLHHKSRFINVDEAT